MEHTGQRGLCNLLRVETMGSPSPRSQICSADRPRQSHVRFVRRIGEGATLENAYAGVHVRYRVPARAQERRRGFILKELCSGRILPHRLEANGD